MVPGQTASSGIPKSMSESAGACGEPLSADARVRCGCHTEPPAVAAAAGAQAAAAAVPGPGQHQEARVAGHAGGRSLRVRLAAVAGWWWQCDDGDTRQARSAANARGLLVACVARAQTHGERTPLLGFKEPVEL